jgi:hypothetical protein
MKIQRASLIAAIFYRNRKKNKHRWFYLIHESTVEPGYNDIDSYDSSPVGSDIQ